MTERVTHGKAVRVSRRRVLIFANGSLPNRKAARQLLQPEDLILCADGGLRHARLLGLTPDVLIGDLDSIGAQGLPSGAAETVIVRHPRDKDKTDLELALDHALERNPISIVIVGGLGARLDHTLGNIGLLADPRLMAVECCLDDGVERVLLCRDVARLEGRPGDLVSLIPWGGRAEGVETHGLRWPLGRETLHLGRTRGISNEMLDNTAWIRIRSGSLLVIHRRLRQAQARRQEGHNE